MKHQIKAIFWDNDGILVDTEHLYYKANVYMLSKIGLRLSEDEFVDYFLTSARGAGEFLRERNIAEAKVASLLQIRKSHYETLLSSGNYAVEGVGPWLEYFAEGRTMGVVTSSLPEHFSIIHSRYSFYRNMDYILTRDKYHHPKPHGEAYRLALKISGVAPEEALVVEDSPRGLMAAREAGIACAVIPRGFTESLDFEGAAVRLNSLAGLAEYLKEFSPAT